MRCFCRLAMGALTILAVLSFAPGCRRDPATRRDRHMTRGVDYHAQGNYRAAIIEFRNVVQADQNFAPGYYRLGAAFEKDAQFREAFQHYARAVALDPGLSDAQLALGRLLLAGGSTGTPESRENANARAREAAGAVLARDPDHTDARVIHALASARLAISAVDRGQDPAVLDPALAELTEISASVKDDARIAVTLAAVHEARRDDASAERVLAAACAAMEDSEELAGLLGRFYERHGRWDEAERAYELMRARAPGSVGARLIMAAFLRGRGRTAQAEDALLQALAIDAGNVAAHLDLATLYLDARTPEKAPPHIEKVLAADARHRPARLLKAKVLLVMNDHVQARALLEALRGDLSAAQELGEAHFLLALACRAAREPAPAVQHLREALKYTPRALNARLLLAELLLAEGSARAALDELQQVLAAQPQNYTALIMSANALTIRGELDMARRRLEAARALRQDDPALFRSMAAIAVNEERYDEAATMLERALALAPDTTPLKLQLAAVNERRGDTAAAQRMLESLVAAHPGDGRFVQSLAAFHLRHGRSGEAAAVFDAYAHSQPQSASPPLQAAAFYLARGERDTAARWLAEARVRAADTLEALLPIASLSIQAGMLDEARSVLGMIPEQFASDERVQLTRVYLLIARGETDEAQTILDAVLASQPSHGVAHFYRGLVLLERRDRIGAAQAFRTAISLAPGNTRAHLLLAETHLASRRPDLALEALAELTRGDAPNHDALLLSGRALLAQGNVAQARRSFTAAAREKPDAPAAQYFLAQIDLRENRRDDARGRLEKVLAVAPDHLPAIATLVSLTARQGQTQEALDFVSRQIARHDGNASLSSSLHELRGSLLLSRRRHAEAEAALETAAALQPQRPGPHLALATLHLHQNKADQAAARYRRLLQDDPRHLPARMALGLLLESQSDLSAARAEYEQLLSIEPDFAPAANNLAWMMLQGARREEFPRALELAERARRLAPGDPAITDTYGYALLMTGRHAAAVSMLQDAAQALPGNPAVWFHLALAYWHYGAGDRALDALLQALRRSFVPSGVLRS